MSALKRRTKTPVLVDRIEEFVGKVSQAMADSEETRNKQIRDLWDEEVRFHFDNGRTEKTLELYIMKYRYALKAKFGPKSTPLAICNMKKLRERLKNYIASAEYPKTGVATSIVEKIERAEFNTAGRKPTVLLRISDFISAMNGMSSREDMAALWDNELQTMQGKARTTIISYITRYRNAIREAFGEEHPMLKIATGDAAMYDDQRRAKMEKIATKHGALVTFENYKQVLKICNDCLQSTDPLMIGIGLIGLTGRRPYEVYTQAEFSPAPYGKGVSKWSILFNGQAKTKQGEGTKFGITYEIPVLTRSSTILAAYDRLRKSSQGILWHKMSIDDFSAETRLPLRDAVFNLFETIWPKEEMPKPYGLRHLYAEVAYHFFAPPHVTKNSYFAAILGHNNNDLETSLSYMTYTLPEDRDDAEVRAKRITERTLRQLANITPASFENETR
ncbi:telomere resolvase [Agrobacterium tumefaciens]|uniref:telomere resolvase n=1 Tax=Agrobacterium tumefaciens TaxID=358 RepID=UPI00287E7407|nr:telomere resolvase [Agrobacterium tumefaciens]MDS7597964.1 telomere resolvase [Agrobacterium tumefaciens]